MPASRDTTPFFSLFFSVLMALFLTTLPIAKEWQWAQPQWLLLIVLYWGFMLPHRFGILSAWIIGLLLDCVGSGLIGLHGLVMAIIAQLVYLLHIRMRTFPAWQKGAVIFVLVGLYQTILRLINSVLGYPTPEGLFYYLSSVSSVLVWPLLVWMLSPSIKKNRYS